MRDKLEQGAWLRTTEFAALADVHRRNTVWVVRRTLEGHTWRGAQLTVREVRGPGGSGGKCYEIALESLPVDLQAKYWQLQPGHELRLREKVAKHTAAIAKEQGTGEHGNGEPLGREQVQGYSESLWAHWDRQPAHKKAKAERRLKIITFAKDLRGTALKKIDRATIVKREFGVSRSTLGRLLKCIAGADPRNYLPLLLPGHTGRSGRAELSAAAWEMLKADYLRLEQPTAQACFNRLRLAGKEHNWTIPSDQTLLRRIKEIPRAVTVAAREGTKELMKLYPAQQRNKSALVALQIVNGDGYKHNVWVEFPDGEVLRAKTWFWQDVYSSKILTWRTDKTENTEVIRLSFGDLVERYGIPEAVLLDNTLAATNNTMSGGIQHRNGIKVKAEDPLGIFPLFGTHVMRAKPDHGQSKPVERAFGIGGIGEYVDKAPEFSGAWTGPNPLQKPDYNGVKRAITLAQLEGVIEREIAAWNAQTGRRSPVHQGRSCDEVFDLSYNASPIRRATEAQRRLWLMASEPVRANSKDGAIALEAGRIRRDQVGPTQANRYWSPQMVDYAGQLLVARFDPKRLHEGVHVWTPDGRYLCFAQCFAPAGFNDTNIGREHNRERNTFMRTEKQRLELINRMDALQVAKHLPGAERSAADLTIRAPKVVRAEFRAPLQAPVPEPAPDTPQDAADRAAISEEQRAGNVMPLREQEDEFARYRRFVALGLRIEAGDAVSDAHRAWHAGYRGSVECREMEAFAENFPQLKGA